MQNLKLVDRQTAAGGGSLLRDVHEGVKGFPIMLVLAGLGDSVEALQECGISRLEKKSQITLGGLQSEDLHEAAEKFFRHFQVRASRAERLRWAEAIAEETCGWPQHLVSGLSGAAEAIIKGRGDLVRSSMEAALGHAYAHRQIYYDRQIKPFQKLPELLAAVFGAMPENEGTAGVALRKAISRAYGETPDLAGEMDKSGAFAKLLHQGLVQDFGHNRYDCPIPSLRAYVEAFCAQSGCVIQPARGSSRAGTGKREA